MAGPDGLAAPVDGARRQQRLDAALRRHERLARQLRDSANAWERKVEGRSPDTIMAEARQRKTQQVAPAPASGRASPDSGAPGHLVAPGAESRAVRRARAAGEKQRAESIDARTKEAVEKDARATVERDLQASMEKRLAAKQEEIEEEMQRYKKELLFMLSTTKDAVQSKHKVEMQGAGGPAACCRCCSCPACCRTAICQRHSQPPALPATRCSKERGHTRPPKGSGAQGR